MVYGIATDTPSIVSPINAEPLAPGDEPGDVCDSTGRGRLGFNKHQIG
jgi:hypothetical protein